MATLGIKAEVSFSTEKTRELFSSFYRAFSSDSINMRKPLTVKAGETEVLDMSGSSFIILHADTYGMENEVLNITFVSATETFTAESMSFLMMNCFNIISIEIENTSVDTDVEIIAVY